MNKKTLLALTLVLLSTLALADWKMTDNPLTTPWSDDVSPDNAWSEYPRPQLVRDTWQNLNGLWDYAIEPVDFKPVQGLITRQSMTTGNTPIAWQGQILVPFAIDSALSGVKYILRPTERLWYRRDVTIPADWSAKRVILHVQACDWEASIYVNGTRIGQHRGGYDPFSFDITDALKKGKNEIAICAWDGTEQQSQAIGKQIMPENRKGFRYQPTGGIWRTVWLEAVNDTHIEKLKMIPDIDAGRLKLTVNASQSATTVEAAVLVGDLIVSTATGRPGDSLHLSVPNAKLWSPETPFLYDLRVSLKDGSKVTDTVTSYFGMRKIEIKKADDGFMRIFLNNKPSFHYGPLDQGYWPDGILTPPSDAAAKYDVQYLRDIGCNMVRVHIKTHPDRWYYWCDKLGLMVWQDMICMPKYGQTVDAAASAQWKTEFDAMIGWLENHPAIVKWIVFNEGWSQHDTPKFTEWTAQRDPSRIVSAASGWTDFPVGQVKDHHDYSFYPNVCAPEDVPGRAIVIGELGGHNIYVPGHTWHENRDPSNRYDLVNEGGRATFFDGKTWQQPYTLFLETVRCLNAGAGCNGAVYTQITDVEHECNGWLTYDRRVSKIPVETLKAIHCNLYTPPILKSVPLGDPWKCVMKPAPKQEKGKPVPTDPWTQPSFDDSSWDAPKTIDAMFKKGPGKRNTRLCLRNTLTLTRPIAKPVFKVVAGRTDTAYVPKEKRDGFQGRTEATVPVTIWLNGKLLRNGSVSMLDAQSGVAYLPLTAEEAAQFKTGKNTIAVAIGRTDILRSATIELEEMIEP